MVAGKSNVTVLARQVSSWGLLHWLVGATIFLCVHLTSSHVSERGNEFSGVSSQKSTDPIMRAPPLWSHLTLSSFQRSCLQMPSDWEFGLSTNQLVEAHKHSVPITIFLPPLFRPPTSPAVPPHHLVLSVPVSVFLIVIHLCLSPVSPPLVPLSLPPVPSQHSAADWSIAKGVEKWPRSLFSSYPWVHRVHGVPVVHGAKAF